MKKLLLKKISVYVLFCFVSMVLFDSYPLQAATEQDGVTLIEKGETEYSKGLYREALNAFTQVLNQVQHPDNRRRLLLDIALAHYALGASEKCLEMLKMFLDENPVAKLDAKKFPKGFLQLFNQTLFALQQKLAERKRIEELKRAEELKKNEEALRLEKEQQAADKKAAEQVLAKETEKTVVVQPIVQVKEQPIPLIKKKKRFPLLLVIAGAVVVGAILYFVILKKPKYKLSVSLGTGVQGFPGSGVFEYKKGESIPYSYLLMSGSYKNLKVLLDGSPIAASGSFSLEHDSTLTVSASEVIYTLQVTFDSTKITGNPAAGTYSYLSGTSVYYSFFANAGYSNLNVTLNNSLVGNSGTITMNENITLAATVDLLYDIRGTWSISMTGAPPQTLSTVTFTGTDTSGKVNDWGTYSVSDAGVSWAFPLSYTWGFDGTFQDANHVTGTWGCYHAYGNFSMTRR
jgi:tetratricopeptide (TPR) repeat protein